MEPETGVAAGGEGRPERKSPKREMAKLRGRGTAFPTLNLKDSLVYHHGGIRGERQGKRLIDRSDYNGGDAREGR